MSTSLLYHAFGVRGYHYVKTGNSLYRACEDGTMRVVVLRHTASKGRLAKV